MYKLILGNVRVTVADDSISRDQAAVAARQTIASANLQGKLLSHIEIRADENDGVDVRTTEKTGSRLARKTLKQSLLDSMNIAVREKLFPANTFTNADAWFDNDTGQEWHGESINETKEEVIKTFESWAATIK